MFRLIYVEKRPGVRVDVDKKVVERFVTLRGALNRAREIVAHGASHGKPELEETAQ